MAINRRLASVLNQAVQRILDRSFSLTFEPNPDLTDHSDLVVVWSFSVVGNSPGSGLSGTFRVDPGVMKKTPVAIVQEILDKNLKGKPKDLSVYFKHKSSALYTDKAIQYILEQ